MRWRLRSPGLYGSSPYARVGGWDAAEAVFVIWVWLATIGPMSWSQTAAHATREDPGNAATDPFVSHGRSGQPGAVGVVLIRATSAKGAAQDLLAGFGVGSVALSWFAVHTLFTLRYARLYYTDIDGGVNFNQKTPPRYLDFAYLAFTLDTSKFPTPTSRSPPSEPPHCDMPCCPTSSAPSSSPPTSTSSPDSAPAAEAAAAEGHNAATRRRPRTAN